MAVTSVLKFLLLLSCVALIAILKPCHHVQHSPGISPITNRSSQVQHGEMAAIGISKDLLQLSCDPRLTVFTASLPQLQDSCVSTPNAHRPLQVQEGEMDDLGHAPIKDVSKEFYPLARDTVETARLNRQNSQFKDNLGFVVHPSIPYLDIPNLRIADFGTGSGAWLMDLAKLVDPSCELFGFDIASDQFPQIAPSNVKFLIHDIFKPLEEFYGTFDIIHVRALCLAIPNAKWDIVVQNLLRLLKPGGWLQWVDYDGTSQSFFVVDTTTTTTSKQPSGTSALQKGINSFHKWSDMENRRLDESLQLPKIFEECGLEHVDHKIAGTDHKKGQEGECSSTMIVTFDRLLHDFAMVDGSGISSEEVTKLVKAMEKEADEFATSGKGNYMRINLIAVIGRKPGGDRARIVSSDT